MFGEGDLPAWFCSLLTSTAFALAMAAVAILCGALARRYHGAARAGLILLSVTSAALACNTAILRWQIQQEEPASQRAEEIKKNHVALQTAQTVAGLRLPVGTVIEWKTDDHKDAEIELPGPSEVSGMPLAGHLSVNEYFSDGHLWQDRVLEDWPCAKGAVRLGPNGQLLECNLSSSRVFPTLTIPAGSHLELTTNNEKDVPVVEAKVMLSEDIEWKAYGSLLPAGAFLTLFADGQPDEIDAGSRSIQVRGLSLDATMHWKYAGTPLGDPPGAHATVEYVKGALLQELVCGSAKIKADQWVGIPATGDRLMVWSENHNYGSAPLPHVECSSLHL